MLCVARARRCTPLPSLVVVLLTGTLVALRGISGEVCLDNKLSDRRLASLHAGKNQIYEASSERTEGVALVRTCVGADNGGLSQQPGHR